VWRERTDTLASGETLVALLERAGVSRVHASEALRAAGDRDANRLRAGVAVTTAGRTGDSVPAEITIQPEVDRVVHLRYLAGAWQRIEEKLAWRTDTVAARSVITSSLYDALHTALSDRLPSGKRSELVWKLADIFEYRVDMSRDLQPGDSVRLLVERSVAPDGSARDARILAASLSVSGKEVDAIRFAKPNGGGAFFDQYGKSLRAAFLRAPVEFRRISSVFGRRQHPILGEWRMHKGTDYAAASGTPVRAIGDGVVVFAGVKSGFGIVLEVRHSNGYVSRYGHLRSFAKGVRRGTSVGIGKTIGYVGMTGLATAPHLHFEMLLDGVQRDPRKALRDKAGEPLSAREKSTFNALRSRLLAALDVRPADEVAARGGE
jgi:murein DD-endopeptidase MepM/ murein hydrolase activator NlpD